MDNKEEEVKRKILDVLNSHNGISMCGIAKKIGVSVATVSKYIPIMEMEGLVVRKGEGKFKLIFKVNDNE